MTLPADGNSAPPGDYLLFLVDSLGSTVKRVPSVARWVRLKPDLAPPDSLPVLAESEIVCNEAWFSFHATADDYSLASSGVASAYDFRYLASSATTPPADREAWFAGMTQVSGEPAPAVSGTTQGYSFTGLAANTWYWFALRSIDVCGNKSTISAFRARTLAASACSGEEFICVHCNSGGGGNRSGEGRTAVGGAGAPGAESPSVLDGATPELDREDWLPVTVEPDADGRLELTLQSAGTRSIAIDRLRLLAVQHDPDELALAGSGSVLTGRPAPVAGAWLDDSVSTPGLVEGGLFEPLALFDGRSVRVELSPSSAPSRTQLVDCTRPGRGMLPFDAGIEVQVRDAGGSWTTAGRLYPRTARTTLAMLGLVGDQVRLLMHGDVRIWGVSELVTPGTPAVVSEFSPLAAMHAGLGDARALLLSDDDARLDFTGPDTLWASFVVPSAGAGTARSLFLAVQAQVGPTPGGQANPMRRESVAMPLRFALHQSRPNPSRGGALIPFELPRAATVRLELFDLQGRQVHRVVTSLEAGRHEWVVRPGGAQLAPGVYTYRLTADGQRAERKLVVLP